jgi:UDP-glucose 4-epimerase
MISCAVIGANGFLGKALSKKLIGLNYKVYCVYNSNKSNLGANNLNISIKEFLDLKIEVDFIYFSAGSFTSSYNDLIYLNCQLLIQIILSFPNSKLIYISSTNVYGSNLDTINESSCFQSPLDYGKAKLAGEFIAAIARRFAILRFTYLYGPKLNNSSFLPRIIDEVRNYNSITLFGKGGRRQDYLHVDDATDLCILLMNYESNDIFLGATGISISNDEIAKIICSNVKSCIVKYRGIEQGVSFYFNPILTFEKLNWKPKIDISEGIKSMLF